MGRLYLAGGVIVFLVVFIGLARMDAASDAMREAEAANNEQRIQDITDDRSRDNEVNRFNDDQLRGVAARWLRGSSSAD